MDVKTYEEIFHKKLTIRDIVEGFDEDTKSGRVVAFGGKLNVRPPYQREFIYEISKQKAVIKTILKGYPLNVMYWAKNGDMFELMDGQQRTISFAKYFLDQYSVDVETGGALAPKTFTGLYDRDKENFLNYPLTVYICDGDEKEKLDWFQIINIAGVRLTNQEMRNAIYNGSWVTDAKRYFSRIDGEGYASEGHISNGHKYGDYLNVVGGRKITVDGMENDKTEKNKAIERQALLEIVLSWAVDAYNRKYDRKSTIEDYMDLHHGDKDAKDLWRYYEDVMEWVKKTFTTYRPEMKGVEWGVLYNKYHSSTPMDADNMANIVFEKAYDEISNPKGVYEAVLAMDIKFIHGRAFDKKDTKWAYTKQKGICPYCHKHFEESDMQGDHIKPWCKGGLTERGNLQMLCADCNGKKSGYDTMFNPWDGKDYIPFDISKWDSIRNE